MAIITGTPRGETLNGASGRDVVSGLGGDDTLTGGSDADELFGGDGDDILIGGDSTRLADERYELSSNMLYGGAGKDIFRATVRSHGTPDGGRDVQDGSHDIVMDFVRGEDRIDLSAYGVSSFDQLQAALSSTPGGDATFDAELGGVSHIWTIRGISKGELRATDFIYSTSDEMPSKGGTVYNDTLFGTTGDDVLSGGWVHDKLYGGLGNDVLGGGAHNDELYGGPGDDELDGGSSQDLLDGGEGEDKLRGGSGYDTLIGGSGNDYLDGGGQDDALDGGLGNDTLVGGSWNDLLDGGKGVDSLAGGTGDDTYVVNSRNDEVIEKAKEGTDTVKASTSYRLAANVENLVLTGSGNIHATGNSLSNALTGNAGENALSGGMGNDKLYGGLGADDLHGGTGRDVFVFRSVDDTGISRAGRDNIFDFSQKNADRMDLSAIDARNATTGDDAFTFIGTAGFSEKAGELRYTRKASDTYVYGDVDGDKKSDFIIHLDYALKLTQGDFVL